MKKKISPKNDEKSRSGEENRKAFLEKTVSMYDELVVCESSAP